MNAIIFDMLADLVARILDEKCGVRNQEKIVLGFSGGADSICLLDILHKLNYQVVIAYFNHQLRPSVENEERYVNEIAEKYKYEFRLGRKDIKKISKRTKKGIEETARLCRYQFLVKVAEDLNSRSVVVAHHADDQVETIMMNLLRGAGLNGLIGMDYKSYGEFCRSIPIIRPLLDVWKDEIESYCVAKKLNFIVDETNVDEIYKRNRIRGSLIPYLEKYNPKIKQGLIRMASTLRDDYSFLSKYSEKITKNVLIQSKKNFVEIDIKTYKIIPISIQRFIISTILLNNFKIGEKKTFSLIENIRKVLTGAVSSHYSRLLKDLQVIVEKDRGYLFIDIDDLENDVGLMLDDDSVEVEVPGVTPINKIWFIESSLLTINEEDELFRKNEDKYSAYLDGKLAKEKIIIRKHQAGDRYAPLGLSGHSMKVSDFWINKKFPKRLRASWPLVFSHKQLIWIPGFQPSFHGRITESTKIVLQLKVERNE